MGRSNFKAITKNKIKIKSRFKATCIWPFNPKAMDNMTQLSQTYIAKPINDQGSEDNTMDDEVDQNQDWGEKCAIIKNLHISEVVF